jgi:hypothetical protein
MAKIGTFEINSSFHLTGRGLVAIGQIVDGIVRIGAYTTLQVADEKVILQISGVEMVDVNSEIGEYAVGLLFSYKVEDQRKLLEAIKLKEQIIEIFDEPQDN